MLLTDASVLHILANAPFEETAASIATVHSVVFTVRRAGAFWSSDVSGIVVVGTYPYDLSPQTWHRTGTGKVRPIRDRCGLC